MDALFKRTGSGDFPQHIKALIQGPPKCGKTSLLATAPGIVIADLESEANGLQSIAHLNIPYVTIDHPDRLQQLLFVMRDEGLRAKAAEQMGIAKIETVAVDTLDALQKLLKKNRMVTERKSKFERDDWGWLLDEMRQIINAFNALPLNVIYTVHTTTKQDDDEKMITMPGLQGAIAEEIAGMVGYSLLMQRTREVKPDGTPYTKYSLKVEGDDKNPHLGNRAAGRLPEVIEPDFKALQKAVYDGLQIAQSVAPVAVSTPVEIQQRVAQNVDQPAAPVAAPAPPAGDDEPINATALQHLTRLFQEVGVPLNEDLIKTKTLGEARMVVKMWNAHKQDAAEGKATEGTTPQAEMTQFLIGLGFLPEGQEAVAPTAAAAVEPKVDGTIEQVQAYTVDGTDLTKVQEAYNLEYAREKPRATLVNWLVNKGAQPTGNLTAAAQEVQTPVQNETPQQVAPPVTSEAPTADNTSTEAQALELVKEELGGEVKTVTDTATGEVAPCEECQKPIDDPDIALLSKTRFQRWLCVSDYIVETRKPRTTTPA